MATWKRPILRLIVTPKELLEPIFIKGKCVYKSPSVMEIRDYCAKEQETL